MAAQMHPRDAILQLIDIATLLADNAEQIAKAKRTLYDAYVKEGFTEAQALELIKGSGL
jgi:hypothetical protein